MNLFRSKGFRLAVVALVVAGVWAPSMAIANSSTLKVVGKAKMTTLLPTVSAHAGVAPVIGKPVGKAPTALTKKEIIVGKGKVALTGSTITAEYVLMSWKSGKVIQSSWANGAFTTPLAGVIPGWQKGIPGMKVGGRRLLVIPPALAYGAAGGQGIGPNETLIFVVDLLGVK